MGLLTGKRLLVTGVLTDASIAFHVARLAQDEGAEVVLSSYGRVLRLTQRISGRLPRTAPVVELDVSSPGRPRGAARAGCASMSTASTACCTRSGSPPRRRSGATS